MQVTPSRLMEAWTALQPDVITLLTDELPAVAGNNRRATAERRSRRWLDACLRAAAETPALRATSCLVRVSVRVDNQRLWTTAELLARHDCQPREREHSRFRFSHICSLFVCVCLCLS